MLLANLVTLFDVYCAATGKSRARVSTLVFNQGSKFDLICSGADVYTRRYEAAVTWFSENWPDGCDWPASVSRPRVQEPAQ